MSYTSTSAEAATLYIFSNPTKPTTSRTLIHNKQISFSSHISKSRISITNPSGPSRKNRTTTRINAFYAPTIEKHVESSLYELLGITEPESITMSDIKKAYKKMARKYHPDVSPPDRVDEYTRKFIMVKKAYETLSNPNSKALYDRNLAGFGDYSTGRHYQYDNQKPEETRDWKIRWQSQIDELKSRSMNNSSRGERIVAKSARTNTVKGREMIYICIYVDRRVESNTLYP